MKNLTEELKAVYTATDLATKKQRMMELIDNSHAKKETKLKARLALDTTCRSPYSVDKFATNYMLSGEGLKLG